jgi:hypothetical protein
VRVLLAVFAIAVLLILNISEFADKGQITLLGALFIVSVAALTVLAVGMLDVSNSKPTCPAAGLAAVSTPTQLPKVLFTLVVLCGQPTTNRLVALAVPNVYLPEAPSELLYPMISLQLA